MKRVLLDAKFEYAVSKRIGEEMVQKYSKFFPTAIIRLAAIYSDWCEYGRLYNFLITWLSKSWKSNILAGKGDAAVPYLHITNLNTIFYKIIKNTKNLPPSVIHISQAKWMYFAKRTICNCSPIQLWSAVGTDLSSKMVCIFGVGIFEITWKIDR